jgi:hypothetical protein
MCIAGKKNGQKKKTKIRRNSQLSAESESKKK